MSHRLRSCIGPILDIQKELVVRYNGLFFVCEKCCGDTGLGRSLVYYVVMLPRISKCVGGLCKISSILAFGGAIDNEKA